MKRIYKKVMVTSVDTGGFQIMLDKRVLLSPAKSVLNMGNDALAQAIAAEWNAQGNEIIPHTMPMMTLESTMVDRVLPQFEKVASDISAYGGSDLLCYRAENTQEVLADKQMQAWQPILDWAVRDLDVSLKTTKGIVYVDQPEVSLDVLASHVLKLPPYALTVLHEFTSITGSLILGLVVLSDHLNAGDAYNLSQLDNDHQAELWGSDFEAEEKRKHNAQEMQNAARFYHLSQA
jgi:chaperone required for assembly of F1-ATPase